MKCDDIEALLYDYAENQLDEAERSTVDAHLESCPDCRENLRLLRDTLPVLDSWDTPEPSPELVQRMTKAAKYYQTPWYKRLLSFITLPSQFMLPVQAVATVAVVYIFIMVFPIAYFNNNVISRGGIEIDMSGMAAPHPVQLKVGNVPGFLDQLPDLLEEYGGQIRRRKNVAVVISVDIEKSQEALFFKKLKEIGKFKKSEEGYRAQDGTVVVVLTE